MTTILPEKNKKDIKMKYLFGFVSKVLNALTIVTIVLIVFEVTVYYSVEFEKKVFEKRFNKEEATETEKTFNEYKEFLSETKDFISLFKEQEKEKKEILDFVFVLTGDNNSINSITIEYTEDGNKVKINGISKNRTTLSEMNSFLSQKENISNIELPIASFTKTFDIPFNLTFEYKHE